MTLGRLQHEGDLERFLTGFLLRPEVRKAIQTGTTPDEVAPTLATGWSNLGGGNATAGYYRANGRVYLKGTVAYSTGGSGLIFTLPPGYRPAATVVFPCGIVGGTGYVSIASTGAVTDTTFSVGSKAATDLSPISFKVA